MQLEVVKSYFGTADIIVFSAALLLSALIGIYYGYTDRKKNLTNYYFGGKNMSPFPVGLSTSVSFISAITVMTYPSDAYIYGSVVCWYAFTTVISVLLAYMYFIPAYHRLQLKSVYELLEKRFGVPVRKVCSSIEIFNQVFYMGINIYLPSLALNAVTPLNLNLSIATTGIICSFYTALGGIKAVIWTDVIQSLLMLLGVIAAATKTILAVGGFGKVFEILEKNDANNIWNFNPDPRVRTTFWSVIVGFGLLQCTFTCINQSVVQRYLSCKSVKDARRAALYTLIPKILISLCCAFGGLGAYAYFEGCDLVKEKVLTKSEQIMPYLVLILFRNLYGLAGIYVAAIFSGTMSTVSSGINSLASILLEDFVLPCRPTMSNKSKMIFSKVTVLIFGILVTSIAYIASVLSGSVVKMVLIFRGACAGPILGVFICAFFIPWTTTKGVLAGQLVGTAFSLWMGIGNFVYGASPEFLLPHLTDECPAAYEQLSNYTDDTSTAVNYYSDPTTESFVEKSYPSLYSISFMYYGLLGTITSVATALLVSFITGANEGKDCDPQYFVPLIDNPCFPESIRFFFRFGVPPLEFEESKDPKLVLMMDFEKNKDNL